MRIYNVMCIQNEIVVVMVTFYCYVKTTMTKETNRRSNLLESHSSGGLEIMSLMAGSLAEDEQAWC